MKVLHLISGGDSGGAKTHVFSLMDKLTKKADVTVVCLMRGVFYEEILERDVRVLLYEQRSRFDLSVLNKLLTLIREEGFDLVHAHG
ncbi:MAG: glycosyltransferase, partial [Clostridia bacterium]|nr:glycosyltransferase [Clostridia bacterium]